jgi:hypothetical protein
MKMEDGENSSSRAIRGEKNVNILPAQLDGVGDACQQHPAYLP